MVSNLRKLDTQSSAHGALPQSGGMDAAQPGRFQELAIDFRRPSEGTSEGRSLADNLRRSWAEGEITERHVLDLLSLSLGLSRVDFASEAPDKHLLGLFDPGFCLKHQIVPWSLHQGRLVIATARPERFLTLLPTLERSLKDPLQIDSRPVVATHDDIQNYLAEAHHDVLYAGMSARVPAVESCRTWSHTSHRVQILMLILMGLAAILLLYPKLVFLAGVTWATLTLALAMLLKGGAALTHLLKPEEPEPVPREPTALLPEISVLVPLYKERRIAELLIKRLGRLNYPRDRLDVVLALEEHDNVTRSAVADLELPRWMRVVVVPDGVPRTKPRAMNYALDFCRGEIIGIYDAEDAPEPDQLLKVAERFATKPHRIACLQGALDYYNTQQNWIARCFTVEYNSWFRLVLPGMSQMGLAVPLGGTTVFMRRDVLEELGGWDAHNVTEDADLGFRLARHGYHTEILASTTSEEANCHARPWVTQRSRWLKGYVVTYLVHLRNPRLVVRQLGLWRCLGFHAHFITAVSQFMLAPLLWSFWLILLGLPHPLRHVIPPPLLTTCAVLFFTAEIQNITLGLIATKKAGHRHLWKWVPTLHFYYPLGCLASYMALYELIFCPFHWHKTQHGHSIPEQDETANPPGT
jgi:glycosyltransferase XagB